MTDPNIQLDTENIKLLNMRMEPIHLRPPELNRWTLEFVALRGSLIVDGKPIPLDGVKFSTEVLNKYMTDEMMRKMFPKAFPQSSEQTASDE